MDSSAAEGEVAASKPRRWPQRVLAAVTVTCLAAAAVTFAVGWRWSEPARLTVVAIPDPPERVTKAWTVVQQWYAAESHGDAVRMRELACAHPAQGVEQWINTIAYYGQYRALTFPDAVSEYHDDGQTLVVRVKLRMRPISERMKRRVEDAQANGGFFHEVMTLSGAGDDLKVCDASSAPGGDE